VKLRFHNYRRSPADDPQVSDILAGRTREQMGRFELADVVDEDSGQTLYQLYLWQPGSGRLYENGTTDRAGYVSQHGLEVDDPDLFDALREAFEESKVFEEEVFFD
jgi:hypothetical protein